MSDSKSKKMMKLEVDKRGNGVQLQSFQDIWNVSQLLVKSGLFGTGNTSAVATKIITGLEMGIDPVRAVRHIDTIEGKPSVSAQLSAAMLRFSDKYDYEVEECSIEFTDKNQVSDGKCVIAIYEYDGMDGEKVLKGKGEFLWQEAVVAGLTKKNNWSNYPRDMLFARAMKRAKRMYAPDVGLGREYMPDELGKDEPPTVDIPDEVVKEAKENESSPVTEPDFEVEEGEPKSESYSEDTSGSTNFNMDVKTTSESQPEPTSESSNEPTSKSYQGEPTNEPKGSPDHSERIEEGRQISKEVNELDDALSNLEGRALLYEIGKYHYQVKSDWKDKYEDKALSVLDSHVERLDLPYDDRRGEISYPTQKQINDADTNLSHLYGEDLERHISNYEYELEKWSEPAKSVFKNVIDRHKQRLDTEGESSKSPNDEPKSESYEGEPTSESYNGPSKGEIAEFHQGIERAKTKLGMKMKDTHQWKPLQDFIDALRDKAKEKPHTDEQWDELQRVVKTYSTIVRMRAAVIPEGSKGTPSGTPSDEQSSPNTEVFNEVLNEFAETLNEWGDDWADKSYEITTNEAKRLAEEVEGFEVSFQQ